VMQRGCFYDLNILVQNSVSRSDNFPKLFLAHFPKEK
jgi:hypothetical protein